MKDADAARARPDRPVRFLEQRADLQVGVLDAPFIDPAASPGALFALSPFEVAFSQKAALQFANGQGWPAGSAVDVEAMGGLIGGEPPAGNFTRVAAAHVSADGKTISTDAGEGVLGLTWVSLRRR